MAAEGAEGVAPEPQKDTSTTSLKAVSASHEVKNFAESLTNLVYLLQHNPNLDDDARKYVHLIEKELEHMRYVIDQTLARYREIADPGPVSVSSVLDTGLSLYSNKIVANAIQVEKRYEDDDLVKAEAEELREVFSNLVVNALQALQPGGKLFVRLYSIRINAQTRGVRVVVADNGAGIPQEHQSKIFQQSFTTKGKRGNGLGLWMTEKIIHRHGGTIRFRSITEKGRSGTVFSVFLPSAGRQKSAPQNEHSAATPTPTAEGMLPAYAHTRLLSPRENRAISRRLHSENYRLLAEIRAQRKRFDMVKVKPGRLV